jgi:hypothetical protein
MVYRGKNSSRGGEVLQVRTRDGCAGQTGQESGQIKLMMGFTATRKSKGHRKGRTEQDDIASGKRGAREHVQHASILRSAPRCTSDASFGKTGWSRARQIESLIRTFNIEGTILCSLPGAKRGRSPTKKYPAVTGILLYTSPKHLYLHLFALRASNLSILSFL